MTDVYRVFSTGMSPYLVEVSSYFRRKGIPQQWILRKAERRTNHAIPAAAGCLTGLRA